MNKPVHPSSHVSLDVSECVKLINKYVLGDDYNVTVTPVKLIYKKAIFQYQH